MIKLPFFVALVDTKEKLLRQIVRSAPNWLHPNHLTLLRALIGLALIIGIICRWWWVKDLWWLIPILIICLLTDLFDGVLARAQNKYTKSGALLDAVADKLVILPSLWIIVQPEVLEPLLILLVAREFLMVVCATIWMVSGRQIKSRPLNQWYIVVISLLLSSCLIGLPHLFIQCLAMLGVGIGYISLGMYATKNSAS